DARKGAAHLVGSVTPLTTKTTPSKQRKPTTSGRTSA
ncbi:MAG: hypothetical protein JWP18_95, partial [Solirubrobacterales bacterium]|nr:hypothetical protein [Solirubrobacterales bacterium]